MVPVQIWVLTFFFVEIVIFGPQVAPLDTSEEHHLGPNQGLSALAVRACNLVLRACNTIDLGTMFSCPPLTNGMMNVYHMTQGSWTLGLAGR